jgi:hypothetical protein
LDACFFDELPGYLQPLYGDRFNVPGVELFNKVTVSDTLPLGASHLEELIPYIQEEEKNQNG